MNTLINFIYGCDEYVDSSGRISAIASFTLGTLLFATYMIFKIDTLIGIGMFYVSVCILINLIILLILLIKLFIKIFKKQNITAHLATIFTMLVNIPITIVYINFVADKAF